MNRTLRVFEVQADRITGEWIGDPEYLGIETTERDWATREDTDAEHFDRYDHWMKDDTGYHTGETETRAVVVRWID